MQTGSGKTYTMLGEIDGLEVKPSPNRGMTPRIFEFLFARIQAVISMPYHLAFLLCISYKYILIHTPITKQPVRFLQLIAFLFFIFIFAGRGKSQGWKAKIQLQVLILRDLQRTNYRPPWSLIYQFACKFGSFSSEFALDHFEINFKYVISLLVVARGCQEGCLCRKSFRIWGSNCERYFEAFDSGYNPCLLFVQTLYPCSAHMFALMW